MFAYCNNCPVNASDPTGQAFFLVTGAIGAIAGAIIGGLTAAANGQDVLAGIGVGAAVGGLAGLGLGAAAGVMLAGSALASTTAVATGASALGSTIAGSGFAAGMMMIADNVSQAINHSPQVFWSGGEAAKNASVQVANSVNGITLEMTRLGQYLEQTNASIEAWVSASSNFANVANNAASYIYSVQNAAGVKINSIWATIEYPLLKMKEIIYTVVQ
jgi:hypothetical protein